MAEESLLDPVIAEFKPVACSSFRMESEFKNFTTVLKDTDPDHWDKRDLVLRKIAGIAMHDDTDREELIKHIRLLKTTLVTQVEDLRSAIVRTASAMIVVLHENLGASFGSVFEFLMPSFVKQLAVKAIPTRESSHECLLRVVSGGDVCYYNDRLLKGLMTYSADKDKVIRTRLAMYVHGACSSWDKNSISKSLKDITDYLVKAQADGESKVRSVARETFALLSDDFPAPIAKAIGSITDQKQKKEIVKLLPENVARMIDGGDRLSLPDTSSVTPQKVQQTKSAPSRASTSSIPTPGGRPTPAQPSQAPQQGRSNDSARGGSRPSTSRSTSSTERANIPGALERRLSRNGVRVAGSRSLSAAPPARTESMPEQAVRRPPLQDQRRLSQYESAPAVNNRYSAETPHSENRYSFSPPTFASQPNSPAAPVRRLHLGSSTSVSKYNSRPSEASLSESLTDLALENYPNQEQPPFRTTTRPRTVSAHNKEDKQMIAAKLADSIDLLNIDSGRSNRSEPTNSQAQIQRPKPESGDSPADLLARLRSLREQVQMLPSRGE